MITTKMCIFNPYEIDRIEKCNGCDQAGELNIQCSGVERRNKCVLINTEAPDESTGLKIIFLGEAPTDGKRFFMNRKDPASDGGDSLATRVWEVIESEGDVQLTLGIDNLDGKDRGFERRD